MAHIDFHWGAMALAALASFIFGFLWYGPIFGRRWGEEMGFDMDAERPGMGQMALPMLGNFVGNFLIAYGATWILSGLAGLWAGWGGFFPVVMVSLIVWTGFYLPLAFSQMGWEQRTFTFTAINSVFYLLNLILVATMVTFIPF